MILINTKTKKGSSNVCKAEAARMVGVDVSTIKDWEDNELEYYHHWIICYSEEIKKQKKGFALSK